MSEVGAGDVDEAIVAFYSDGTREWDRLNHGRGLLGLRRTQELWQRSLPPRRRRPSSTLDG